MLIPANRQFKACQDGRSDVLNHKVRTLAVPIPRFTVWLGEGFDDSDFFMLLLFTIHQKTHIKSHQPSTPQSPSATKLPPPSRRYFFSGLCINLKWNHTFLICSVWDVCLGNSATCWQLLHLCISLRISSRSGIKFVSLSTLFRT